MTEVYCQIALAPIPDAMCAKEQGVRECSGCAARTRRCTACASTNGITDARNGLCASCAATHAPAPPRTRTIRAGRSALDAVVARLLTAGPRREDARSEPAPRYAMQAPAILEHPEQIRAILAEHAVVRGGACGVIHPLVVLSTRLRLTYGEAQQALDLLLERKDATGDATFIRIAGVDAPPEYDDTSSGTQEGTQRRIVPPPGGWEAEPAESQIAVQPNRTRKPRRVRSAVPWQPAPTPQDQDQPYVRPRRPEAPQPIVRTLGQIFNDLAARARVHDGERIVRGAVPLLQVALKVGPRVAVGILETLAADARLAQRDGWRTIAIIAGHVDDDRVAFAPVPRERPYGPRPLHIIGGAPQALDNDTVNTDALDAEIAKREEQLRLLRDAEVAVKRRHLVLDAELTDFRSLRQSAAQTESPTTSDTSPT